MVESSMVVRGARLRAISCVVPARGSPVSDFNERFGADQVAKIVASTGIANRHVSATLCTSDLCAEAARQLFESSKLKPEDIDALVFVTQTPDYQLPATACALQARLGLKTSVPAFDVNLGCSGYVYGLWLAASLIAGSGLKRVLLLVGDTISHIASDEDRSVALLFGDAGTASLIEADAEAPPMHFSLGTDGRGVPHLIVPAGGFRQRAHESHKIRLEREGGNLRADNELYMNGAEIFSFTLARVPQMIDVVMRSASASIEMVDAFVFHQANRFMLQHLAKRMKLPPEKFVLALEQYGNTSSASIPIALCATLREQLSTSPQKLVLAGFGVGYSWAACHLETDDVLLLPVGVLEG